jgi:deoxyribonuclease-4
MSIAGGLPRAIDRAVAHGCDALQIFTKNASQWRGKPLPPEQILAFRACAAAAGIAPVFSHASYLINLASANRGLRRQSIEAMTDELDRAEALGLFGVVLHPGCYTDGNPLRGLTLIADALSGLLRARPGGKTMILLEHTAGQGTSLGATFEEIAAIIDRMKGHVRVGVCLDTCHLVASGYELALTADYEETFRRFERIVGLDRLRLFHLNDSKKPPRSRVDRHTHIGEGFVGIKAFGRLVNDPRFRTVPMLIETPKSERTSRDAIAVDPLDEKNLRTLRGLLKAP